MSEGEPTQAAVDLTDVFAEIERPWCPHSIAQVGDFELRAARLEGEFVWHSHELEDELFFVVQGELELQMEHRNVTLRGGQLFVVPKGTRHRPVAKESCLVLLFEPKSTQARGDAVEDPHP
jgi:mannose-6-phosphate isomerase-like protein (cupin superfamily)